MPRSAATRNRLCQDPPFFPGPVTPKLVPALPPQAFFQTNTRATEVLYQTVIDMAQCGPGTTLIDVCCGTGSIGICMAKVRLPALAVEIEPMK